MAPISGSRVGQSSYEKPSRLLGTAAAAAASAGWHLHLLGDEGKNAFNPEALPATKAATFSSKMDN